MTTPANPMLMSVYMLDDQMYMYLANFMPGIKAQPLGGGLPYCCHSFGGGGGLTTTDNFCSLRSKQFNSWPPCPPYP